MLKKKKKYNLKSKITSSLRRLWYYSPHRREAVYNCKIEKNTFRCNKCRKLTFEIQIDHIEPVVPLTGFDGNWTEYINRMFCDASTGLQGLCKTCHDKITKVQNKIRKQNKNV